jgi:CMP-N,N'-diacetyllegionaminic acid synthase
LHAREDTTMKRIIGVIPARGGSKGLPRKNIKDLNGIPLIAYSINAAKESKCFDRIIVSTDNAEIKNISLKYGAEVIDRPENLAQDNTPMVDAILDMLRKLESSNYQPDIIVLLQPTSPLRDAEDIRNALSLFTEKTPETVISVKKLEHSPYLTMQIENGFLTPLFGNMMKVPRQKLPETYMPNGAIYIITPGTLRKYNSFYCVQNIPYVMREEKSVDVDTELELLIASTCLNYLKRPKSIY